MRETRLSGSEGGVKFNPSSLPLSTNFIWRIVTGGSLFFVIQIESLISCARRCRRRYRSFVRPSASEPADAPPSRHGGQFEAAAVGFADERLGFGRVDCFHRGGVPLDAFAGQHRQQADQQCLGERRGIPEAGLRVPRLSREAGFDPFAAMADAAGDGLLRALERLHLRLRNDARRARPTAGHEGALVADKVDAIAFEVGIGFKSRRAWRLLAAVMPHHLHRAAVALGGEMAGDDAPERE